MGQRHDASADDWMAFPGGELEGRRPKALCAACREKLQRAASQASAARNQNKAGGGHRAGHRAGHHANSTARALCFQCYRADLERQKSIRAAGELNTTSDERFQSQLPFEPLNRPRLQMLKAERAEARVTVPIHEHKRRHAQIEARHALQRIAAGLKTRGVTPAESERVMFQAIHAAELQLPDAWLPFVVSR